MRAARYHGEMTVMDLAYLVFGQTIPTLDVDVRADVVELLNDGEFGLALDMLLRAIDRQQIAVDAKLLAQARQLQPHLV